MSSREPPVVEPVETAFERTAPPVVEPVETVIAVVVVAACGPVFRAGVGGVW